MNHAFLVSTAARLSALVGSSVADERTATTTDLKAACSGNDAALNRPCNASILHGRTCIGFSEDQSAYACNRLGTNVDLYFLTWRGKKNFACYHMLGRPEDPPNVKLTVSGATAISFTMAERTISLIENVKSPNSFIAIFVSEPLA